MKVVFGSCEQFKYFKFLPNEHEGHRESCHVNQISNLFFYEFLQILKFVFGSGEQVFFLNSYQMSMRVIVKVVSLTKFRISFSTSFYRFWNSFFESGEQVLFFKFLPNQHEGHHESCLVRDFPTFFWRDADVKPGP